MIRGGMVKTYGLWMVILTALLLAGCGTLSGPEALPQRSDLFQLSNEAQLAYESGEDARA